MLERHIWRYVHHDRHDEAALVTAPYEAVLLLADLAPLLAVHVVHDEVVVGSQTALDTRDRVGLGVDHGLELAEGLVYELGC